MIWFIGMAGCVQSAFEFALGVGVGVAGCLWCALGLDLDVRCGVRGCPDRDVGERRRGALGLDVGDAG
jgi:hypothetical protein